MIKVSIIIPIYNVEEYVRDCIQSVMNQTLQEIEIICVDDASTDGSPKIVQECANIDKRVSVIMHNRNMSTSQARKDGTMMAKGEYILFLDGDDYLDPNTCEELYKIITEQKVDILHFGTRIINKGNADKKRIQNLEKLLQPLDEKLLGKKVFQKCFIDHSFRFSICNKMFSSKLCKKAFKYVQDGYFPMAEDLYAFFIICYFAESYFGISSSIFYNYHFGAGITGNNIITLKKFEKHCQSARVADAIDIFVSTQQNSNLEEIAKQIRLDLLYGCVGNWFYYLPRELSARGFELLTEYWGVSLLVSKLCSRFYNERRSIAKKVFGAEVLEYNKIQVINTIGIFYYRFTLEEIQKVISILIPMYLKLGYKVVFFTEELNLDDEYELPENVQRIVLPSSQKIKPSEFEQRAVELEEALHKYQVDIMLYHAASSRMLLFDMLLVKLKKIPFIITVHEVAFQGMLSMNIELANKPDIYRLADYVTVLSKVEEKYWRLLAVKAIYVPNPIEFTLINRDKNEIEPYSILWLGRLDFHTKRCMDTIDAMNHVVKAVPEVRLLIVGNEFEKGATEKLENRIKQLNLEENVKLCGHSSNVDQYYRKAGIHLLTSKSETFPMTIIESKAYGIPLVMYELPFLEITRLEKGFVSIPQGDIKSIADALVRLLKDDEYRERMGKEAQESLLEFNNIDLNKLWEDIFNSIKTGVSIDITESKDMQDMQILMHSFLSHYEAGCIAKNEELSIAQKELRKTNQELEKQKKGCITKNEELNIVKLEIRKLNQKLEKQKKYYEVGFIAKDEKIQESKTKLNIVEQKLRKTNEKLKKQKKIINSKDYKLGHIILYIPRIAVRYFRKIIKNK